MLVTMADQVPVDPQLQAATFCAVLGHIGFTP
jgi:hypothetical protein